MDYHEITKEILSGGEKTSLIVVRLCGMDVPPEVALDMSGSLHLTNDYLLSGGQEDLKIEG